MPQTDSPDPLVSLVNPLQGSDSRFDFSRGNCLPLVSRPFGMTAWTPQTDEGSWIFHPGTRKLQGIRATHQPSPWIGDYGHFTLMPQTGPRLLGAGARSSAYTDGELHAAPHELRVYLRRYETRIDVTATERCGHFRVTFPEDDGRIILEPFGGDSSIAIDPERGRITGYTRANSGGVPEGFACYFVALLDRPAQGFGLFHDREVREGATEWAGDRIGAYLEVATAGRPAVEIRVATSFISVEQAERNLEREIGDRDYETVRGEGERTWAATLGRVRIEGATDRQARTFYSCLYRALLFPHLWYELDAAGRAVHYSPYDGQVHPGFMYADNGFWDTHRTVYPFLSLVYPEAYAEIIDGWSQACRESGWSPRWPSPGNRSCMISTHLNAVLADAYVKGFRSFDVDAAYRAMMRDATEPGDDAENYGRKGIVEFGQLGFVPADRYHHAASCTLDYAYNDHCIAQVARGLGRMDDYRMLRDRAFFYRNVYDPRVGFMRGRNADGSWEEPFDEFKWGGPYVEGGAWQCSWAVPHDPAGLIALVGGPEAMEARLDRMLALPPRFEVGSYGFEIHEMTEMACAEFGQYAHSNQPVHHVLYLYACAGRPWKTQYWVRRVLDEMYGPGADGFAGDEDNGEMSCWYLMNALGFFPFCPGHPSYLLGSPLFSKATIALPNGKSLVVSADGNGPDSVYVQRVTWNGAAHGRTWISHEALAGGGELAFVLGDRPNEMPVDAADLPFSASTAPEA